MQRQQYTYTLLTVVAVVGAIAGIRAATLLNGSSSLDSSLVGAGRLPVAAPDTAGVVVAVLAVVPVVSV